MRKHTYIANTHVQLHTYTPTRRHIDPPMRSLLPAQRPVEKLSHVWPSKPTAEESQYGRVYQFQFVPLGFFGRLILRVHHTPETEVHSDCAWLNGLVCSMGKQKALLLLNEETHRLELRVRVPTHNDSRCWVAVWVVRYCGGQVLFRTWSVWACVCQRRCVGVCE
jgi:hypothetical protein